MKNQEQRPLQDKGFQLFYYRLSYRRRFIRTVWLALCAPFLPLCIHSVYHSLVYTLFASLILAVTLVYQLRSTYQRWKQEDK